MHEDWSCLDVVIWSAEEIPKLNAAYEVKDYAPGLLLIGSDGGGEALALDTRSDSDPDRWPVVLVPFIGMSHSDCISQAPDFAAWLSNGMKVLLPGREA